MYSLKKMVVKKIFLVFLFLFSLNILSQNIFKYEKEIDSLKYNNEEIEFLNSKDKIKLSGTLIYPKKEFEKIVIIVPGSGKDTRNSHYILAENLLENGIAVFRFDERGIGKSEGKYSELSTTLSTDLEFAFNSLKKKYNNKKIGLLGHSMGGIAILEVIQNKGNPDFIVLIETPIVKNGDFVLNQIEMDFDNCIPKIMQDHKTKGEIIKFLKDYFGLISKDNSKSTKTELKKFIASRGFNKKFIVLLDDSFLVEMLNKNIEEVLKTINIPVLYQTGTKDKIINHNKEIDLIKSFNNKSIEIEIFKDLNHYLTEKDASVGTSLYKMDQKPLGNITKWILNI